MSQYNPWSCNTLPHQPCQPSLSVTIHLVYCNTIPSNCIPRVAIQFFFLLQYNSYPLHNQRPKLRYKAFYHNTIWAVAQVSPCTKLFFVFLSFFLFFFSFLPATGKYQKKNIYILFFFHFPEYSNKFIKIYFLQFSSILQIFKT